VTLRKVTNAWAHYETAGSTYKLLCTTALTSYSLGFIRAHNLIRLSLVTVTGFLVIMKGESKITRLGNFSITHPSISTCSRPHSVSTPVSRHSHSITCLSRVPHLPKTPPGLHAYIKTRLHALQISILQLARRLAGSRIRLTLTIPLMAQFLISSINLYDSFH
jgi:hypothetical protein